MSEAWFTHGRTRTDAAENPSHRPQTDKKTLEKIVPNEIRHIKKDPRPRNEKKTVIVGKR